MFSFATELERAASEVQFSDEFFVSLDFSLFLSFYQEKERKSVAKFLEYYRDFKLRGVRSSESALCC
jgi:hypothetical protein